MCKRIIAFIAWASIAVTASNVNAGSAVVTDGKFTNIYVYHPNSDKETCHRSGVAPDIQNSGSPRSTLPF
jgi:hypothetical protein